MGLSTDIDKSKAAVPYDKDNISTFAEVNEVYVAANGNYRNKYTVRDGFATGLEISRTGLQR